MKYIDADKLIAEIERLYYIAREASYNGEIEGEMTAYDKILSFITSIQQEQPPTEREIAEAHRYAEMIRERDRARIQQEQPEVDLEKAALHVYESWMGGTMDDVRRDMIELGKVLNARKED